MDPQQGPPQPDLLIGQTIGNYLVTQKLGEGGMGSVYLAEHPSIGKKVALKVLHSEFSTNQEVAARFFHEAKAVNDIGHPNIVDIVDFGILQAGGGREQLVYFIMEYLAGSTLSHLIRTESPLPPERALGIALQVADALSASHRCNIVHRDLKPDNIILLQRGRERDFVKLLDFGIAKLTGGSAMGSHRTRTGIVMGTPAYMSPEQCEGRDSVDLRTDVYALGIVLYEMLTGRVPFLGDGYGEILVQHLTQRPVPPSQFRMLPPHVEVVVMKALEKRADMRYPSMDEFMRAMSDPVGYVEAHGGVAGFLQRQLTPSTAPLTTSVRLTPTPLTPLPGTLIAPGVSTPAPTTLGSATGQVPAGGRSRVGYVVAGLVIVAAAVAAILVVVTGENNLGEGSGIASGSAIVADGSAKQAGTEPGSAAAGSATPGSAAGSVPTVGSAATVAHDAGSAATPEAGSAGSGEPRAGSDAPPQTGSGSGATPSGPTITVENVAIEVASTPPGARIFVDGSDAHKVTPATLHVPKKVGGKLSIVLKLKGYNTATRTVELDDSAQVAAELSKIKVGGTPGPGPGTSGTKPPGTTGPKPPGGKTGSAGTGSADPDGLMHP